MGDVRLVPVESLTPHPANPRLGDVEAIRGSIRANGFYGAVIVQASTGLICAGSHRWRAAQLEGMTDIPAELLDVDDATALRIVAADNRTSDVAGYDDRLLGDLLVGLRDVGGGLDGSGFDDAALDALLADLRPKPVPLTDPDDAPEPPTEPVTQRGDVWQLGPHRLICGDATSDADHSTLLEGVICDLVLTDPPYGVGVDYGEGFTDDEATVAALIDGFMPLALRHGRALVTSGRTLVWLYPRPKWVLAWVEPSGVGRGPWGFACTQLVLAYGTDPYLAAGLGARPDTYVGKGEGASSDEHPVAKPAAVWSWLMERGTTERGQTVLDPFAGSGTTIIAAHQLGRVAYGIELSPAYCDVICARFQAYTGVKPSREGVPHDFLGGVEG